MDLLWMTWRKCGVMDDRLLVDTSVWIEAIRRDGQPEFRLWLKAALVEDKIFMAPPVKTELLSGSVNEKQFDELIVV